MKCLYFSKLNDQALSGISLDPETKMGKKGEATICLQYYLNVCIAALRKSIVTVVHSFVPVNVNPYHSWYQ